MDENRISRAVSKSFFRTLFDTWDTNKNGVLEWREFKNLCLDVGFSKEKGQKLFHNFDINENGVLDEAELMRALHPLLGKVDSNTRLHTKLTLTRQALQKLYSDLELKDRALSNLKKRGESFEQHDNSKERYLSRIEFRKFLQDYDLDEFDLHVLYNHFGRHKGATVSLSEFWDETTAVNYSGGHAEVTKGLKAFVQRLNGKGKKRVEPQNNYMSLGVRNIYNWLVKEGFKEYAELFRLKGVDGVRLSEFTKSDLSEIGVQPAHQQLIWNRIQELRGNDPNEHPARRVKDWNTEDVAVCLQTNNLAGYIPIFRNHRISGSDLLVMNRDRLLKMGVNNSTDLDLFSDLTSLLKVIKPRSPATKLVKTTKRYKRENELASGSENLNGGQNWSTENTSGKIMSGGEGSEEELLIREKGKNGLQVRKKIPPKRKLDERANSTIPYTPELEGESSESTLARFTCGRLLYIWTVILIVTPAFLFYILSLSFEPSYGDLFCKDCGISNWNYDLGFYNEGTVDWPMSIALCVSFNALLIGSYFWRIYNTYFDHCKIWYFGTVFVDLILQIYRWCYYAGASFSGGVVSQNITFLITFGSGVGIHWSLFFFALAFYTYSRKPTALVLFAYIDMLFDLFYSIAPCAILIIQYAPHWLDSDMFEVLNFGQHWPVLICTFFPFCRIVVNPERLQMRVSAGYPYKSVGHGEGKSKWSLANFGLLALWLNGFVGVGGLFSIGYWQLRMKSRCNITQNSIVWKKCIEKVYPLPVSENSLCECKAWSGEMAGTTGECFDETEINSALKFKMLNSLSLITEYPLNLGKVKLPPGLEILKVRGNNVSWELSGAESLKILYMDVTAPNAVVLDGSLFGEDLQVLYLSGVPLGDEVCSAVNLRQVFLNSNAFPSCLHESSSNLESLSLASSGAFNATNLCDSAPNLKHLWLDGMEISEIPSCFSKLPLEVLSIAHNKGTIAQPPNFITTSLRVLNLLRSNILSLDSVTWQSLVDLNSDILDIRFTPLCYDENFVAQDMDLRNKACSNCTALCNQLRTPALSSEVLGDGVCDPICNSPSCGYDGGDCLLGEAGDHMVLNDTSCEEDWENDVNFCDLSCPGDEACAGCEIAEGRLTCDDLSACKHIHDWTYAIKTGDENWVDVCANGSMILEDVISLDENDDGVIDLTEFPLAYIKYPKTSAPPDCPTPTRWTQIGICKLATISNSTNC